MFYQNDSFRLLKNSNASELLSLPAASFFKVLPLPEKFNRFQLPHPCFMCVNNSKQINNLKVNNHI